MTITLNGTTGITTPAITDVSTGNVAYTGTLTGGTGVVNLGSGQLVKDTSGNLGSGTSMVGPGSYGLYVRNSAATAGKYRSMYVDSSNNQLVLNDGGIGMYMSDGATAWSANSDERLKTTLIPFTNAVEKVCTLRSGTGRYLTDESTVSRSFLIAQDVLKVLPEAVNVQADEMGTLGLAYTDLIPLLTAAIQEQQALIVTQQAALDSLTTRLTALENN